jgi:hypothetical protein
MERIAARDFPASKMMFWQKQGLVSIMDPGTWRNSGTEEMY